MRRSGHRYASTSVGREAANAGGRTNPNTRLTSRSAVLYSGSFFLLSAEGATSMRTGVPPELLTSCSRSRVRACSSPSATL